MTFTITAYEVGVVVGCLGLLAVGGIVGHYLALRGMWR